MEILRKPVGGEANIERIAERIFHESIRIAGGLKGLVEYRNLTWLPSLAEASYVIALKNEAIKTNREIAEYLGITEQTVKNILSADERAVEEYLKGERDKADEHIAGGLAKLAYHRIKDSLDNLEERLEIMEESARSLGVDWAVHVLSRIKGLDFPVDKDALLERLGGYRILGNPIEDILERIEFPVRNPAELLHKLRESIKA
ncbi:MAG: KaiC associated regulatory domain-containing protein [Euryarchaeota archaeon]|nr:KaiC associated regulatory domain-containing protein [Euryarchaeota archaeon]